MSAIPPDPVQGFSPAGQLLSLLAGYWVSRAIMVAAELGIADHLGRTPTPVEALARATGANADALYRVLRALASAGIFTEAAPRAFALTPMGALLKSDAPGSLRAFARFQGEPWHWESWGAMLASLRSGRPAILERFGAADCFEYLARHPASAAIFNDAMSGHAAQVHAAVADAYDFSAATLVVDVGGGHGTLLARILERSAARGILLDLPEVVTGAAAVFAEYGVADRATAIGGDFFSVVPAGGDVYLLSTVIHGWDDDRAIAILQRVRAAMQAHGRVLIVENVIAPDDEPHPGKLIDLEMLVIAGGRERTEAEYRVLVEAAGLVLTRALPTAASVSIVEARRA